jgi:hypothetical protein
MTHRFLRRGILYHEFIPLLDHPRKLFIAMGTIGKAFARN